MSKKTNLPPEQPIHFRKWVYVYPPIEDRLHGSAVVKR